MRSRTTSAWFFLWAGLVFLALHPVPGPSRAIDLALAPTRWLAELARPLALLRASRVAAAERTLARSALAQAEEGAETLAQMARRALPTEPGLREGRRFLEAEVLERPNKDECWVRLGVAVHVDPGAPVVCGNAFVGRVVEWRAPGLARVQLVTERGFRIGARVLPGAAAEEDPVFLTVGGVRVPRRGEPRTVRLAAYQPSSSGLVGGLARVHELLADEDDAGGLAEGFHLGEVRRERERGELWIEPELDFLDGLFHVALLLSPESGGPPARPVPGVLEDGRWLSTHAVGSGDPEPWRSTRKIPLGRGSGLEAGAAVSGVGAQLVGRITHVGSTSSDIALLDDPGFSVAAIARVQGHAEPRTLGRLTTIGRGAEGVIRMHWPVRVDLDLRADAGEGAGQRAPEFLEARLFSGPGDPGLPGGLFLGSVRLPVEAHAGDELQLELRPGVVLRDVRALFVRHEARELGP